MKYPCWYSQSRAPKIGDRVLVLYKTRVSESYRVGKIQAIDESKRNLELLVSPPQTGNHLNVKPPTKMCVPIQRTILIYSPYDEEEQKVEDVGTKPKVLKTKVKKKIRESYQDNAPEIRDVKRKRGRPAKTQS